MPRVAVIGGSGIYRLELLTSPREVEVDTPFGRVPVQVGRHREREVAFLARHGAGHALPPHRVNYRANIWALRRLGVRRVIATNAVGSLREDLRPGDFVLVDQFIDLTRLRASTFFEGGPDGVVHVDMTEPYCPWLRAELARTARELGLTAHAAGTYVCTEGPRFETPAEIRAFAAWGGDVVGMTGVPEVVLAREAGLCYASVALVTNFAAGMAGAPLSAGEVFDLLEQVCGRLASWLDAVLPRVGEEVPEPGCACARLGAGILPGWEDEGATPRE